MPFNPEPLKTLAWKAFYKHLLGLLPQVDTHTEAEMVAHQNAIRLCLADYLDDHFNRPMNSEMRAKYVGQFYKDVGEWLLDSYPEIWQLLDAVLDNSFEKLDVMLRLPERFQPDLKVVDAIARRCPRLKILLIDFSAQFQDDPELAKVEQVIRSLSSLRHLSRLYVYLITNKENVAPLLRVVSESCPILSRLYWEELVFAEKRDVLALILGDLVGDPDVRQREVEWSADEVLQSLRVPSNRVSPLCSTLRHLNLGSNCTPATLVFLLRHMPLLQIIDGACDELAKAVLLFQNAPNLEEIQEDYDQLWNEAARRLERRPLRPVSSLIPLSSSGPLSLIKLDFISLSERDVLEAVGSLCPSLKEVEFGGPSSISPEELNSILSKWPKLVKYTVGKGVSPEHKKIISKVFGSGLIANE